MKTASKATSPRQRSAEQPQLPGEPCLEVESPAWADITTLADRFDCLALTGGMVAAMQQADRVRTSYTWHGAWDAPEHALRASLSFECRAWQHCRMVPQGPDRAYIAALYERVRAGVPSR